MLLRIWLLIVVLSQATSACAQIDYKGFPEWSWHKQDSTEYYLYTPKGMEPGKRYPVALFLHGCCGESYTATLRNTVDPPARMWHGFGSNQQRIPTYIIAPATSRGWSQHFKNLKSVIDALIAAHNADPARIYISGFSMGGEGVFNFIQQYPGYFAAAIPMGMSFYGDSIRIKDIPLWINQGENDWWSRGLKNTVTGIRRLNGDANDTGSPAPTGINPRYTSFKGVDHGVQWIAASAQDLVGWAYSKKNDGNKYPVVFFKKPGEHGMAKPGTITKLEIEANDPDGSISSIMFKLNGRVFKTITQAPYIVFLRLHAGDQHIEAVATDDKGKTSTAMQTIHVDEQAKITDSKSLPAGRAGALYNHRLQAKGNGTIRYEISSGQLPSGVELDANGTIKGVVTDTGHYRFEIKAIDMDNDEDRKIFHLNVGRKKDEEVVIRNAKTKEGKECAIRKVTKGETLFSDASDNEVSFSSTGSYEGYTLVKPFNADTSRQESDYLSFDVDEDVIVYIGYEKKDRLFRSSVPSWLNDFQHQPTPQIVAQYYYYDVYAKAFPRGKIILPGADEKRNHASTNYFVMVKKQTARPDLRR